MYPSFTLLSLYYMTVLFSICAKLNSTSKKTILFTYIIYIGEIKIWEKKVISVPEVCPETF